jgi:hypothetical protein
MLRAVNRLLHRSCIVFLLIYLTLHASSCSLMPDDYDVEYWETVPGDECQKPGENGGREFGPGCRDGTGGLVHLIWKCDY